MGETLWETINPYITQILVAVLTTIVSYVVLKLKRIYEKTINGERKYEIVKSVVEMVEQISKKYNWTGEEKYNKAKETSLELLNNEGIKITELELEVLIESVCKSFKSNSS